MKKTIVFLLILIGFFSEAQVLQLNNTYGWEFRRFYANTLMGLPKDTFAVPATLQDIPFIANKAGTLYTWNITTHVWGAVSAGGGASGIDDVLAIGQSLTANRTLEINNNLLTFELSSVGAFKVKDGTFDLLTINPPGAEAQMFATDGTLFSKLSLFGNNPSTFNLIASQGDGSGIAANISGTATATESTLDLAADSIRFIHNNFTSDTSANYVQTIDKSTGTIGKAFWPSGGSSLLPLTGTGTASGNVVGALGSNTLNITGGGETFLIIDPPNFSSSLFANDGTASSSIGLNGDLVGGLVNFNLSTNSGVNTVSILGNPITNTLVSTADSIRMMHNNFVTDTAVNYVQTINKGTGTIGKAFFPTGGVTNVATGLGLSGGPITTTGTILVDTANASILSRQRADATYQPLGVGISTLNTLTDASQSFAVGTTGADFNIVSAAGVHTFHIPDAGTSARGLMNTGSQTIPGSKIFSGFFTPSAGFATNAAAGNANIYVTGGVTANRVTTAAYLPESAAGLGLKTGIHGSTAYTMTASDAFSALAVASNLVTEAASGTHPLISSLVLRAPVVTNGAGATANMATFYIDAAPSGVTPTGATYAQWIKAGGLRLGGDIIVDKTITAAGTTGNQTINKLNGTVNIAAAGTTVTVTNSFVTASSTVLAVIRTNDSTAVLKNVVPGVGSFVINLTAAANAEISIGFLVIN